MLSKSVTLLRRVVQTLVACHTPPELAAGFTLGMLIGLLPKGNLIALSLCVLLFSLRVNKGLAVVAAVMFSCLATSIDPFTHKLGLAVLSAKSLQLSYACVFNLPFGPWLGFNNTVISGTLLFGLYVAYPVYYLTLVLTTWIEPRVKSWLNGIRGEHLTAGYDSDFPTRTAA